MAMLILSAVLSTLSAAPDQAPIRLLAEPVGDGVRLVVLGDAASEVEARYALEVKSDASGGNNASVQRGTARLAPGETKRLMTLTLGNVRSGNWTATLSVEPNPGEAYRQVKSSAE